MIIVLNSTPIIYLAKIGKLDLLKKVYDRIYIPKAVYGETIVKGMEKGFLDAKIIQKAIDRKIIEVKGLLEEQKKEARELVRFAGIEIGEAEAIILARHTKSELIADDVVAQGVARTLEVQTLWTTSFIIRLVSEKFLKRQEAREIIEELIKVGYKISEDVLLELLKKLQSSND